MKKHIMKGYQTPIGIETANDVMQMQKRLGVTPDGIWGPKTQNAYDKMFGTVGKGSSNNINQFANDFGGLAGNKDENYSFEESGYKAPIGIDSIEKIAAMQKELGIKIDGIWGSTEKTFRNQYLDLTFQEGDQFELVPELQQNNTHGENTLNQIREYKKPDNIDVISMYSGQTKMLTKWELEMAEMKLSPDEAARFLWASEYNIKYIKDAIRQADISFDTKRIAENLVRNIEYIKKISPQFASLIARDVIDQGIENIATFTPQKDYTSILRQSVSPRNKEAYHTQAREWAMKNLENSRLSRYEKAQMILFVDNLPNEKLDRYLDYFASHGFDKPLTEQNKQTIMTGEPGSAGIATIQTPGITEVSGMRPYIEYQDRFEPQVGFSNYYFDKKSYYIDIYRDMKYKGRIALGDKIPENVSITAVRSYWALEFEDQFAMLTNIYIQGGLSLYMDELSHNEGSVGFGDIPVVGNALDNAFPTYINNITEDTILVSVRIKKPTHGGTDFAYDRLLV